MPEEPIENPSDNPAIEPEADEKVEAEKTIQIPEGSRVVTIIIDKGEVTEKVYQSPDGDMTIVKY